MIGMIMFGVCLFMLLWGFPVAFTFGGVALIFGLIAEGPQLFAFMPFRIMSIMQNTVLMAIPLFIYMGIVLQRTRLAEQLLESMGRLFGGLPGDWRYPPSWSVLYWPPPLEWWVPVSWPWG